MIGSLVKAGQALIGQAKYQHKLPTKQLNGKEIEEPLQFLPLYVTTLGEYQEKAYQLVIDGMRKDAEESKSGAIPDFEGNGPFWISTTTNSIGSVKHCLSKRQTRCANPKRCIVGGIDSRRID
ncbi:MAG: hypothetical protein EBQ97_07515 [Bacteroidetes bacterium]|nr:hypothetical protein [Bacteroidota bacterium]